MKKRTIFQIVYFAIALTFLYYLGLQLKVVISFAIIIVAFLIIKGPLYKKIDKTLTHRLKFLSKINPKLKKVIIFLIFIIIFIAIKDLIYFILNLFGIDIQKALTETINNSLQN